MNRRIVHVAVVFQAALLLIGCVTQSQRILQEEKLANIYNRQGMRECDEAAHNHEFRNYSEYISCTNDVMYEAYSRQNYPFMDLITLMIDKNSVLAEQVDKKAITLNEAKLQRDEYDHQIWQMRSRRMSSIYNTEHPKTVTCDTYPGFFATTTTKCY